MSNGLPPTIAEEVEEDPRRQRALPPPDKPALEGEHIPAEDMNGSLDDAHTTEAPAAALRGKADDINLSEISIDWVLKRLVKEANDYGTRTRQTGRLKALELIGEHLGMWGETDGENEHDQARRKVKDMPAAERRERLLAQMAKAGLTVVPKEKAR